MTQLRLDIGDHQVFYKPPDEMLPATSWKPPRLADLPSWVDAKRVAVDVETKDPEIKVLGPGVRRPGNRVVGVSFAIEDGPEFYLAISHEGGDNCEGDVWAYLRDQIKNFNGVLVGNGIGYDLDWMTENKCDVLSKRIMDVQVADPLINELHMSYNLDALCARHGLSGKDESILRQAAGAYRIDPKKELWKLPARYVGQYGAMDARRPLQVLRRQEIAMQKEGVESIWELEQKVTPILVKMRRRGVRVDVNRILAIERMSMMTEATCLAKVKSMTGVQIAVGNVWKNEELAAALKAKGYQVPLTPKTQKASIDKAYLNKCGELGRELMRAREWNKLRTTFAAQVKRALIGDRVHVTFNQLKSNDDEGGGRGVRYGRFSSSDFNIQQQPIRHDEFGEMWRRVFIADHDARWACSDWSQQEPRIGVHYAELLGLPGAKDFGDEYRRNPGLDIHQKLADLSGIERKIVKNYVNGRLYGMGDAKLCRAIGKPTMIKEIRGEKREVAGPEGQAIIDQFNKFAPWVVGLTRAAADAAKKNGHVWTIMRRKCHFPRKGDGTVDWEHKAFNRVGQGSAADQMKATLVAADAEGIPIQMAVHDEFDMSFDDIGVAKRLKELQMNVVKFSVPMKVDLEVGESWGELEKVGD
jgi:DNA polymerase I-like protein with 3'-5' exonuclease and polymerase domains